MTSATEFNQSLKIDQTYVLRRSGKSVRFGSFCPVLGRQDPSSPGLPEVFRAFSSTGCQIRLISAFFPKIRLAAILIRKIGKLSDMIHDI